uniref:Uncharacterized protein n=1 Tax=Timema cristinae TaxID=61476 RepID=A0A7R9DB01_TIMCR|nr:unnamed protein product [Timema cristinae]
MEFFGASRLGYANPVKETLRCDYKEPSSDEAKFRTPVPSPELDVYHGQYDGRAYSSYDKLKRLRRKGSWHPQAQHTLSKKRRPSIITPEPALREQQCSLYLAVSPSFPPLLCRHAHNSQIPRRWHCEAHSPSQIYRTPITSAQSIGWFVGDEALGDLAWARTKTTHSLVRSEITRSHDLTYEYVKEDLVTLVDDINKVLAMRVVL